MIFFPLYFLIPYVRGGLYHNNPTLVTLISWSESQPEHTTPDGAVIYRKTAELRKGGDKRYPVLSLPPETLFDTLYLGLLYVWTV